MVFHDPSANYLKVSLRLCFKNMSQPRPLLSFIFGLFNQTSLQILQQIKIHQVFGTGIWTHDFGYMSLLLCNLRLIHVHYLPKAFRFKMREWRNLLAKDGSLFTLSSTLSIRKVWSTLPGLEAATWCKSTLRPVPPGLPRWWDTPTGLTATATG